MNLKFDIKIAARSFSVSHCKITCCVLSDQMKMWDFQYLQLSNNQHTTVFDMWEIYKQNDE